MKTATRHRAAAGVGGYCGTPTFRASALKSYPASRACYDRKRTEGTTHFQAMLSLAQRRLKIVAESGIKASPATGNEAYDYYWVKKQSFAGRKDRSSIVYNQRITLAGIPEDAYGYQVNGKAALEWIIDRYQVTTH